jgi:hypothetical protein
MSDLRDAAAVLGSLKAAYDLSKAFLDVRGTVQQQGKVFELQSVILAAQQSALSAQEAQSTLSTRISELEKRIAELEAWGADKERYQLTKLAEGVSAYALKPEAQRAEPPHHLCANCFHENHKSILQQEARSPGISRVLICPRCGAEHYVWGVRHPEHRPSVRRSR